MAALSWKKLHNNLGISNLVSFSSSITSCSIYNSQWDSCLPNSCHHKVKLAPKKQTVLFSALYKHVHARREARPHAKYHKTVPTDSLAICWWCPKQCKNTTAFLKLQRAGAAVLYQKKKGFGLNGDAFGDTTKYGFSGAQKCGEQITHVTW